MTLLRLLLEPGTPLWLKIGVVVLLAGVLAAWWMRPYWYDLDQPDKPVTKRQARPPFD